MGKKREIVVKSIFLQRIATSTLFLRIKKKNISVALNVLVSGPEPMLSAVRSPATDVDLAWKLLVLMDFLLYIFGYLVVCHFSNFAIASERL